MRYRGKRFDWRDQTYMDYGPGAFVWDQSIPLLDQDNGKRISRTLWLRIPSMDGVQNAVLRVTKDEPFRDESGQIWQWDGDEDNPTLRPVIYTLSWQGWLKDGFLDPYDGSMSQHLQTDAEKELTDVDS